MAPLSVAGCLSVRLEDLLFPSSSLLVCQEARPGDRLTLVAAAALRSVRRERRFFRARTRLRAHEAPRWNLLFHRGRVGPTALRQPGTKQRDYGEGLRHGQFVHARRGGGRCDVFPDRISDGRDCGFRSDRTERADPGSITVEISGRTASYVDARETPRVTGKKAEIALCLVSSSTLACDPLRLRLRGLVGPPGLEPGEQV